MRGQPLSESAAQRIRELAAAGLTPHAISRETGCGWVTVHRVLNPDGEILKRERLRKAGQLAEIKGKGLRGEVAHFGTIQHCETGTRKIRAVIDRSAYAQALADYLKPDGISREEMLRRIAPGYRAPSSGASRHLLPRAGEGV